MNKRSFHVQRVQMWTCMLLIACSGMIMNTAVAKSAAKSSFLTLCTQ